MAPPPPQSHRSPSPSQPSGKSEVSDLKSQLRQLAGSRAPGADDSKRDLFKKVISNMTIGIDVSSLFGEMVMCSATSDIVLKKMCYLYVGNYAKGNPDLALLTINFLQRDCKDEDPMIRGLALRSLCSLRVANLVEYLVGPLGSGLKDNNSYVRMVAVIGVLKLYHISTSTCIDADFPATLKHLLLNDPDTQVVANCLSALQEIWTLESSTSEEAARERETLLSKPVVYYLLNRHLPTKGERGPRNQGHQEFQSYLLGKWRWNLFHHQGELWARVLDSKYGGWRNLDEDRRGSNESFWWQDLRSMFQPLQEGNWFQNEISWKVGFGARVRFWEDWWKDVGVLLMLKHPRLYLISCQQEQFIQQMGRFSDAGWEWSFQWRRSLFYAEIDVADRFLGDTEGISIHPDRQDKWVWKGDSSGNYSVGSAYKLLLGDSMDENQDGVFNELWNLKIPSKASFLLGD